MIGWIVAGLNFAAWMCHAYLCGKAIIVLKNTIKTLVEETNVSYGSRLLDELDIK